MAFAKSQKTDSSCIRTPDLRKSAAATGSERAEVSDRAPKVKRQHILEVYGIDTQNYWCRL